MKKTLLQDWVQELTLMQQSVLLAAIRGPDGIRKDHPVKVLCRWLRRSILISAFDKKPILDPSTPGGGSFTGPSIVLKDSYLRAEDWWQIPLKECGIDYLRYVDELPHHFQLHFMHAAEIIGYKHSDGAVKLWWNWFYLAIVNDAHLRPEPVEVMDKRLGNKEADWRAAEEVTAK